MAQERTFEAKTSKAWRQWLTQHGQQEPEVWLVVHGNAGAGPGINYLEAVDHALCFGWIDSTTVRRDEHSRYQRFTPRNPRGTWSKVNRQRVARLIEQGLMTPPGQAAIDHAKRTGTWSLLADAEDLIVPADLQQRLEADAAALRNFTAFPPSSRRMILAWVATAKRPETRQRRIAETATLAAQNLRAHHPTTRNAAKAVVTG